MQKSASVLRKWIESQDPFRLYPSAFNPKDYRIPMETGVSRKIILRVWAGGTTALCSVYMSQETQNQSSKECEMLSWDSLSLVNCRKSQPGTKRDIPWYMHSRVVFISSSAAQGKVLIVMNVVESVQSCSASCRAFQFHIDHAASLVTCAIFEPMQCFISLTKKSLTFVSFLAFCHVCHWTLAFWTHTL